jgi:hypothetical protein
MKTAVILQDVDGRPERIRALRSVHPYVRVFCPPDKEIAGAVKIDVPAEWLPVKHDRPHWWKADALALAAARTVDADSYWFIESDVAATPEVWSDLFATHEDNPVDCLAAAIGRRGPGSGFRHWEHPGTPRNADRHFIMAVYRLSRRAVAASIAMAEDLRETFSEVAVPYVMKRSGLSMADMNGRGLFWSPTTFRTKPQEVRIDPRFLNHPVKHDSFSP